MLQFSTSYFCEQALLYLTIKSTERNRLLSGEEELRICLLKFSQVFNLCTNGNMLKFLAECKAYVGLVCVLYFDV
jgi:hypothetical protein